MKPTRRLAAGRLATVAMVYNDDQDALHSSEIYSLLENEIVPMFYERREETPREWMRRVKESLTHISPDFDCRRMVHEYMTELYEPAHSSHTRMRQADYALSREKTKWNARVREVWDRVRFVDGGPGLSGSVISGTSVAVRAVVDLAGLKPSDVQAEVVIGRVDSNGHLEETEVIVLPFVEHQGTRPCSRGILCSERTGTAGVCIKDQPESLRRSA